MLSKILSNIYLIPSTKPAMRTNINILKITAIKTVMLFLRYLKIFLTAIFKSIFTPNKKGTGSFEPRLSYYYGTNGILFNPNTKESETFEGNNIGLGFQTSNGYRAWSFDLIYILSSGLQDRIKEINNNNNFEISKPTSKTRIAIGYHWLF